MFKLTPIGSCRIAGPLRHGQASYGIHLNQERCYGYCHSPAEAVQMARFMQGNSEIDPDVWPLISRSHQLDAMLTQDHEISDLYVVELASAKEVTIDGMSIQLNYLNSVYADFFSDPKRAQQFWACAEKNDGAAMDAFLSREWSNTEPRRSEALTLGKIRLQFVTRQSLRNNIKKLTQLLPDVLFVSHVDARKPDRKAIKSRSKFIQLVAEEAQLAGCKFYDPTELMVEFGQSAAIEDESTGLAHFTKAFSEAVMDDWMRQFIAPKTDNAVRGGAKGALNRQLQPQITTAFQEGRFADACVRLAAISSATECANPLLREAKQSTRDAQNAFKRAVLANAKSELAEPEKDRLVRQASSLGLFEAALNLATQSPGGIKSLPVHTLLQAGIRAKEAGDTDNAFEFFLAAVSQNPNLKRANAFLVSLAVDEEIDLLAELKPDQSASVLAHVGPVQKLQLLQLNNAPLTAAISETSTARELADIVSYLAANQGVKRAAEVLIFWRNQRQTDRISDRVLLSILDEWVATALGMGNPVDRLNKLNMILEAAPRHPAARNAKRDVRKQLVDRIRRAGKDGNIQALDALTAEVAALKTDLPEFDLWRARLRYRLNEYGTALSLAQAAATHLPDTLNVWVLLMRSAARANNPLRATEYAHKVIELTCIETETLKFEAEALLQSEAPRQSEAVGA